MSTLEARGVEFAWTERGAGPPVLLIHETAATRLVWEPLAETLATKHRAISYDRRGWGESGEPDDYRRTTVEEQSEDAAALLESVAEEAAVVCGAGLGAVIALDLMLRRDELVSGAVLVEPTLLQLSPLATEGLSQDRHRIEIAATSRESILDVFVSGGLPALGPGVTRMPEAVAAAARERPRSVMAELGIAAAWRMPLPRLASADRPAAIVTADSTPGLVGDAARALASRVPQAEATEVDSPDLPPHAGAPVALASIVAGLSS
jgi:pimeloyl-ACP methyl ester carboxylesterase